MLSFPKYVTMRKQRQKLCEVCSFADVGWYVGMPSHGHLEASRDIPVTQRDMPVSPAWWQHWQCWWALPLFATLEMVCPRYVFPPPGFRSWRALECHATSLLNCRYVKHTAQPYHGMPQTLVACNGRSLNVPFWLSRYAPLNGLACGGMSETVVVSNVWGYLYLCQPQPVW